MYNYLSALEAIIDSAKSVSWVGWIYHNGALERYLDTCPKNEVFVL